VQTSSKDRHPHCLQERHPLEQDGKPRGVEQPLKQCRHLCPISRRGRHLTDDEPDRKQAGETHRASPSQRHPHASEGRAMPSAADNCCFTQYGAEAPG
jgi:hypothetical protein